MGFVDLRLRHLFHHFLKGNGRIRIASDSGQRVPHIRADEVGCGHASAHLVIPTDAALGTRVALERGAQVPLKRTHIVARDTQPQGVHHADQFFGLGVAAAGGWQKLCHRLAVTFGIHQIAAGFNLGKHWADSGQKCCNNNAFHVSSLVVIFGALACAPAYGNPLPKPLQGADFVAFNEDQAKIGQLLFFDPILSGNRNIACATCHHPELGSGDGLSLGIGEGGEGLGRDRTPGQGAAKIVKRIPRNAPALWNLGAREIDVLFHDGRLSVSRIYDNGFDSPAQEWLPEGLDSILAAQALFPMTAEFEMAGNPKENQIAGAVYDRIDNVWPIVAKRVRVIPEYADMFVAAFDDVDQALDIDITHIANALAAFETQEFTSFDSPFDAYLNGDQSALNADQQAGLELFYGKADCSSCHSGQLLSDQKFHALMLPHFGPGKTRQWDPIVRDVGRMGASDRLDDAYKFRTPALRNVALTAPYGHNGAYADLEAIVRHHLNPRAAFEAWNADHAVLPEVPWLAKADFLAFQDTRERARLSARTDIETIELTDHEVTKLVAFLHALTGTESIKGRLGIPEKVPSGLEVPK
ncbi:Cytochrome c551 peroxidase precursor [Shimia sp. SK013]|nr:Cytochrome c551 peroxidase precursor [Shimia sp. SK013]